jgi:Protein of unknown function (DUF3485)
MNRQKWMVLTVTLILIGSTAVFLGRMQTERKLGRPGLKMVSQPIYDENGKVVGTNTVDLPAQVLNYQSRPGQVSLKELGWLPRDTTYARRFYRADDRFDIMLSVVLMGTDRGSIHKPEICLVGQGWKIDPNMELLTIPISGRPSYDLPVKRLIATKTLQTPEGRKETVRSVYVYWFVAEREITARHGQRMWWTAKELMRTGTLQRWAYVSCLAHCLPGQEEATYNRLKDFIAAAVPEFQLAAGEAARPAGNL